MGMMFDTPDGIAYFRLVALKGALEMQVKGLNVVRHGSSGTAVAKRDYGLRGQAKTMLPIVAQQVEDLIALRGYSGEYIEWAVAMLLDLKENCEASPDPTIVYDAEQVTYAVSISGLPEEAQDLILTVYRVLTFEEAGKPSVRVQFRHTPPAIVHTTIPEGE